MPCEGCNIQFNIFKRKRNCRECKRLYCSQCLVKFNNSAVLCEKCIIFTKRPLLKVDLEKLKSKDLIYYLQSKHISTKGCLEKDELVNLILAHANLSDDTPDYYENELPSSQTRNKNKYSISFDNKIDSQENFNAFDQIKQHCHNFFTNFTEKIPTDLNLAKENKPTPEITNIAGTSDCNTIPPKMKHFEYEFPLDKKCNDTIVSNFDECKQMYSSNVSNTNDLNSFEEISLKTSTTNTTPNSPSSPVSSDTYTLQNQVSTREQSKKLLNQNLKKTKKKSDKELLKDVSSVHKSNFNSSQLFKNVFSNDNSNNFSSLLIENETSSNNSGCDCSDDELIANFKSRKRKTDEITNIVENTIDERRECNDFINSSQKCENSSVPSFEELGAVGGSCFANQYTNVNNISSDHEYIVGNHLTEDIKQTNRNSENCTYLGKNKVCDIPNNFSNERGSITTLAVFNDRVATSLPPLESLSNFNERNVIRRRSDGFIYNTNRAALDMMFDVIQPDLRVQFPLSSRGNITATKSMSPVDEESDDESEEQISTTCKRLKKTCLNCGKNKRNLRKEIIKFKEHLENSNITEEEIRNELKVFLEYLENRSKSVDSSEESAEGSNREFQIDLNTLGNRLAELHFEAAAAAALLGDDEGIHVYTREDKGHLINQRYNNRFLNLSDFQNKEEIDNLSVKQLKEILMLYRVDYKGCCEKYELLERVLRLWKDMQECPSAEKLPTDDLCKICMDAPIECVILECGHLATCTNCGKVLNECPICRQYIVRVVRFFRA